MTLNQFRRIFFSLAGFAAVVAAPPLARAQVAPGATFDYMAPSGGNYDTAAFRLWYPKDAKSVRAILVLVPGSNDDSRSWVDDSLWRAFAERHQLALVSCFFFDRLHPLDFIENYADVSKGSGQALVTALTAFAGQSKHPELAGAPLLFWGMSAGGEFNYEFTAWKPERVLAFIVNKGGIYYSALVSPAARDVPGLLITGGKDLEERRDVITGLFAINRRAGALWALTEEPGLEHVVGRSRQLATIFFEDMLALRLDDKHPGTLKTLTERSGFLGDFTTKTFQPVGNAEIPLDHSMTAWLPTERVARAWRAVVTGTPFDPSEH